MGIGRSPPLDAILMRHEPLLVEAQPAIELVVIEQDQPRGAARRDLDIAFEAVAGVARDQQQRRGIGRRLAPRVQQQRPVLHACAAPLVGSGTEEVPFGAIGQRGEVVGQRLTMAHRLPAARLLHRLRQVATLHPEPAVRGPFDGVEQRLPSERPEAVLIAMIDGPPAPVRGLHQRGMAARPPFLVQRGRADQRIARMMLPRPVDRSRPRRDHHMPGGRPGRPAHRGDQVVILAVPEDLGSLGAESLDVPAVRIAPGIVDMLRRADRRQAVGRQPDTIATRQEQPARAVLAHRMAGIDMVGEFQVDRVAPRPLDPIGPDHPARGRVLGGNVEVVAALVLAQLGCPYRADVAGERSGQRPPVHQIARMPDDQTRIGVEGREGHVIIPPVLQDGRIGMVSGHQRIEETAVAQIGYALVVIAAGGRRRGGTLCLHARHSDQRGAERGGGQGFASVEGHAVTPASKGRVANGCSRVKRIRPSASKAIRARPGISRKGDACALPKHVTHQRPW